MGHLLLAVSSPQRTAANVLIVCFVLFSFYIVISLFLIFYFLLAILAPSPLERVGERPFPLI